MNIIGGVFMIFTFGDTFNKAGSGGEYNNLTTVPSITGDKLPTVTGCGYLILRRLFGNTNDRLSIYIDGNTQEFPIGTKLNDYGLQGGFYKFYFQKSIRIVDGISSDTYFYQTLLADSPIDKYNITMGVLSNADYITITGKGKIVFSPARGKPQMFFSIDGLSESRLNFDGDQYMEFVFDKSFKFNNINYINPLYYIVYLEK